MTELKKPVILQVVPELATGGAERTAIEISQAVTRAGGSAHVISEGGRLEAELAAAGGNLVRMQAATKNPLGIVANAWRMTAVGKQLGASLIHARSRAPGWSARIAAARLGVPFITTYHGIYNQRGRLKSLYNSVMASGDLVIANSEFTARMISSRHAIPPERLRVIHRGVDLARFAPSLVSNDRVAALREKWGVGAGQRIVLHAARLTKWKGQTLLVDAVAAVKDARELDDVVFLLVGDAQGRADYEELLRQRIAGHGLSDRIRLTGHCEDMPAAFKAAHIAVVSPLEPEAFGRVSVEAQAMGCPVIATRIGALPETLNVGANATGWLTVAGDALDLAEAIRQALMIPDAALAPMRRNATAFAGSRFSIEQMQAKTLSVYDEMLQTSLAARFKAQIART